jgi:hypothetical protein
MERTLKSPDVLGSFSDIFGVVVFYGLARTQILIFFSAQREISKFQSQRILKLCGDS